MKEIVSEIKDDIDKERTTREQTEETLLNLLDSTCAKLNAASQI